MRTSLWLLTSLFTVTVAACGDDGSGTATDTTMATMTATMTATMPSTMTDGTGSSTAEPTTAEPTTVEPTTVEPTTASETTEAPTTDATTTTGGGDELTCDNYCEIYETACKDFSAYQNTAACLAQCGQWPLGEINATGGDSLGCRLYHVTVASGSEPNVHCPHAGPSGDGVCADGAAPTCESYCTTYFANCKDDLNLYTDMDDCMKRCSGWYPGKLNDAGGDSVGCRLYHAGAAIADAPLHCPHAGPGGADVCVTP